jgi:hypothetical protein
MKISIQNVFFIEKSFKNITNMTRTNNFSFTELSRIRKLSSNIFGLGLTQIDQIYRLGLLGL